LRYTLLFCLNLLAAHTVLGQASNPLKENTNKGSLYFYWGWNQGWYSNSDVHFSGDDYDFTLKDVIADDRQSDFSFDAYLNPTTMTIPQYNFRIGYYFKEDWDISFGVDHMKYVMQQYQTAKISGVINANQSEYDGTYENDDIVLDEDFLKFEHTDGLNYLNIELRHTDKLFERDRIRISLIEGLGGGILYPKTNTTLWGTERYDDFNISGYGIGAVVGVNVTFFNGVFIQSEMKGGFMGLPNVRTTVSTADKAIQNFFFSQLNIVFGGIIQTKKKPEISEDGIH
jgi:hypothetical protein